MVEVGKAALGQGANEVERQGGPAMAKQQARRVGGACCGGELGAISDYLPFPAEILKEAILARFRERKPALVAVNEQAFEAGRAAQAAT